MARMEEPELNWLARLGGGMRTVGDWVRPKPGYLPPSLGGRGSGVPLLDPLQTGLADSFDSGGRFLENKAYGQPLFTPRTPGISSLVPQLSSNRVEQRTGGMSPDAAGRAGLTPPKVMESSAMGAVDALTNLPVASALGLGKMALGAVPNLLPGATLGAITLKGAPDLVLHHAFSPHRAESIAHSGGLVAPSLGVTSDRTNRYDASRPQFVFRAGAVEPGRYSTLINRDGYFENPLGLTYDPKKGVEVYDQVIHDKILKKAQATSLATYGTDDLRLGQSMVSGGQGLSIMASPAFPSLKTFEQSPFGAGALRQSPSEVTNSYLATMKAMKAANVPNERFVDMYASMNRGETTLKDWPVEMQHAWNVGKKAGSEMAEMKVQHFLPFGPDDAVVYAPEHISDYENQLAMLKPLRDRGFRFTDQKEVEALGDTIPSPWGEKVGPNFARLANPEGGFTMPPRLPKNTYGNELFEDFIEGTPKDLPTSPHYVGKKTFLPAPGAKPELLSVPNLQDWAAHHLPQDKTPPPPPQSVSNAGLASLFAAPPTPTFQGLAPPSLDNLKMQFNTGGPVAPAKAGWKKVPAPPPAIGLEGPKPTIETSAVKNTAGQTYGEWIGDKIAAGTKLENLSAKELKALWAAEQKPSPLVPVKPFAEEKGWPTDPAFHTWYQDHYDDFQGAPLSQIIEEYGYYKKGLFTAPTLSPELIKLKKMSKEELGKQFGYFDDAKEALAAFPPHQQDAIISAWLKDQDTTLLDVAYKFLHP